MTDTPTAKERAQAATGTASEESRHVAGVAQQEASNVASEAATQARRVVDDAMTQVNSQSKEQKDRLATTLRSLGDDLGSMADRADPGLASEVTRQVSGYARSVGQHLQSREPGELLDDVRGFARKRPGTFLLGALAAGVVVGRLVRGTADGIAAAEALQGGQGEGGRPGQGGAHLGTTPTGTSSTATGTATGTAPVPVPAATEPTYPGAPSGEPFVPDPREIHDTHGHETGASGGEGLR